MHDAICRVAQQTQTPLVDVRHLFELQTEDQIPGDDSLIDHVHPRIEGHQQVAGALFDEMVRLRLVSPHPDWKTIQTTLYTNRLQTLEPSYFPQSVARLRGLRRWTEGRVSRIGLPIRDSGPDTDPQ